MKLAKIKIKRQFTYKSGKPTSVGNHYYYHINDNEFSPAIFFGDDISQYANSNTLMIYFR